MQATLRTEMQSFRLSIAAGFETQEENVIESSHSTGEVNYNTCY